MSGKYAIPEHISIVKGFCVEYGTRDNTWTWCYASISEALEKVKAVMKDFAAGDKLRIGVKPCGRNPNTGEVLELVPEDENLRIGGMRYTDYEKVLLTFRSSDMLEWPDDTPESLFGNL